MRRQHSICTKKISYPFFRFHCYSTYPLQEYRESNTPTTQTLFLTMEKNFILGDSSSFLPPDFIIYWKHRIGCSQKFSVVIFERLHIYRNGLLFIDNSSCYTSETFYLEINVRAWSPFSYI